MKTKLLCPECAGDQWKNAIGGSLSGPCMQCGKERHLHDIPMNSPKAQAKAMARELLHSRIHSNTKFEDTLSTALEKLLTENEGLKEHLRVEKEWVVSVNKDNGTLLAQLTATEAKLSRVTTSGWLKHAPGCAEFIPLYGCRCGLTDFLSTLTAAKKESV